MPDDLQVRGLLATLPPAARLVRGAAAVALAAAPAGLLGGCAAAIVPLAAGGLIARSQAADQRPSAQDTAPAAAVEAPPELRALFESPPAPGGVGGSPFSAFVNHALAASRAGAEERLSALLAEPSSLAPDRSACTDAPAAVLIDLDPTGGLAPLEAPSPLAAGLGPQLAELRSRGITVAWITDRAAGDAGALRRVLRDSGLDAGGADPLLVMRYPGEAKQARRRALGGAYCILAIAGDERADFEDVYLYLRDARLADLLEGLIGDGWFLVPPPLDAADPSPAN